MRAEAGVVLYVRRLLLWPDFNRNCSTSKNVCNSLPNIAFHENAFSNFEIVTCRQTERHGEAIRVIFASFLCESAKTC